MRIRGEVYKKRAYHDDNKQKGMNVTFLELDEFIKFNGDFIKIIPIISYDSINFNVGEKIELDGVISYEYIITSIGKRSYAPVPVIRV